MPPGEVQKDSREYLREVIRSNGQIGKFWVRDHSICVQIRHQVYGDVRFLVDPEAFGGRGCIYDAVRPKHVGDPFGWQRIDFAEFAKRMTPTTISRFSLLGRRSASEARAFVGASEPCQKRTMSPLHYAIADKAPEAAESLAARMQQLTDRLLVDGQRTLSASLLKRGETSDPTFESDMLSLYDLLGEACVFNSLFGHLVGGRAKDQLNKTASSVKTEVQALCASLDKDAFDITMLNMVTGFLDSYIISLSVLTDKSVILPALTPSAFTAFAEEVYYELLERRTMAENILAASLFIEHPRNLQDWISELRYHDYALRELLDKEYSTNPRILRSSPDMSVFHRDRFGFPPEIAWWMWHAIEKETGATLVDVFAFNPREVSQRSGLRTAPSGEVTTSLKPKALIGNYVEILIVASPLHTLQGMILHGLKVVKTAKSDLDETTYFIAVPAEPIIINTGDDETLSITKVKFGSSLYRSPPQAVMDEGFNGLMKAKPHRRVIVDVSVAFSSDASAPPADPDVHLGFGHLGLVEPGQPSVFEIQRFRLVEEFVRKQEEEAKAWEVDYRR